jgi:hypothetical protein
MGLLAAALTVGVAMAATAAKAPTYIFSGYSFGPIPGVNTAELEAKLTHKAGDRITSADVSADHAIIAKELEARHIPGRLYTSLAEKHGHVWVIMDVLDPAHPNAHLGKPAGRLKSQNFEGASQIPAGDLAAATGLKQGDRLWPEKIKAARDAIVAAYAKSVPGKAISLKARLQTASDGEVTLTWIIGEPP